MESSEEFRRRLRGYRYRQPYVQGFVHELAEVAEAAEVELWRQFVARPDRDLSSVLDHLREVIEGTYTNDLGSA